MYFRTDWPKKRCNRRVFLLLDASETACYDARTMTGLMNSLAKFYFYFYFGDDTRPHLLRLGESATACEA